jgi:hypothetical protein
MKTLFNDLGLSSRRKAAITGPPLSRSSLPQSRSRPIEIHQTRTSLINSRAKPLERERNPYTGARTSSTCRTREPEAVETREARHYRNQNSHMPPHHPGGKSYSNQDTGGSKYGRGPSLTGSSFSALSAKLFPLEEYRSGADEKAIFTGEFNRPEDAEKWNRYQEAKARQSERTNRPRETSRDSRGMEYETYARNY